MSLPLAIILLPLVAGTVLCAWLGRERSAVGRRAAAWTAALVALAALGLLASTGPQALGGQPLLQLVEWVPAIGLNLAFRIDALAWMFAALISGMGVLIVLYAGHYLHDEDPPGKFFATLMLFMAAMLGIVLSDNVLVLIVFWELTSISSFLLIGYWGTRRESRRGARMALAVTGGGGLALLGGFVLLGQIAGTYEISQMAARAAQIQADPRFGWALALILLGAFTKSAQFPFHFWLPEAMAAPTPVSAYLHSATMVKAGLFLLMRLYPVIGGHEAFAPVVGTVGLLTMVFAAGVALFRHDLKGLLAYSTISHLGFIAFLIGLNSPLSAVVAVFHVLNHAAFKAALFMTAGIVDHETGTRDMRRLGGLMRVMPWMGSFALIASAAMAGIPPFNGFISKEMMLEQALHAGLWGRWDWAVAVLATLGGLFSMAYSARLVHDVFFNGSPRDLPHPGHEPAWGMKAPVALLVTVCVVVGLMPFLAEPLVRSVSSAVLGSPAPAFHLALWHGLNLPLAMSVIAVVGGALWYGAWMRGGRLHRHEPGAFSARAIYQAFMDGCFALAGRVMDTLDTGSLQRHLAVMIVTAVGLAAWAMWGSDGLTTGTRATLPASPLALALWLVLVVAGVALLAFQRQRFVAVVIAGGIGLVASMTFLGLSAPDLALTQLSVDVVSTILLLMGLALLPQTSPRESSPVRRVRDAVLAGVAGLGVTWLTWLMLTRDHDSIAWYFLRESVPAGGGANAVNVILVDFRGYDTFGEITVLGIAAVGALAVLDGLRARRSAHDPSGRAWSYAAQPLMLRVLARLVLPLGLAVSAYIFWRGHNQPGGGFIAGLVTSVALVLQYMALGKSRAEALMHDSGGRRFVRWIGYGLGIAWLTGVGAFFFGRPFLTSAHGHPALPLLGEVGLATAALFDLGVYITVVGATLLLLAALGGASVSAPRPAPRSARTPASPIAAPASDAEGAH